MSRDDLLGRVETYYTGRLREHGTTARGVDWSTAESQRLRFAQLARLLPEGGGFSVNDHGCGYGALLDFLRERGGDVRYTGNDLSADMVEAARGQHAADPAARFVVGAEPPEPADFTVASGVFNVRLDRSEEEWRAYVLDSLDVLARSSRRGFAFNALTLYSDVEKRRPDLHYADPRELFDHCMRRYSRHVALLHDTPLWEFTILVRLPPEAP
jgi:SAM-dependent methyltransferase